MEWGGRKLAPHEGLSIGEHMHPPTPKRNRAKCAKCEDVIESTFRHDFVSCKCGAIFVDGGMDYFRAGFDKIEDFIRLDDEGNAWYTNAQSGAS